MIERAALAAEMSRLGHSDDRSALRDLRDRLHQHVEGLHAYSIKLHEFHERVGPIGA